MNAPQPENVPVASSDTGNMESQYHAPEPGNERYPEPKSQPVREEQPTYTPPKSPAPSSPPDAGMVQVETRHESSGEKPN
jgi:hypothetical protein